MPSETVGIPLLCLGWVGCCLISVEISGDRCAWGKCLELEYCSGEEGSQGFTLKAGKLMFGRKVERKL